MTARLSLNVSKSEILNPKHQIQELEQSCRLRFLKSEFLVTHSSVLNI